MTATRRGGGDHGRVEALALLLGLALGVVEPGERLALVLAEALVVEQDRGRDERAGERPAAGLVGAGDEAAPELLVEAEEPGGPPSGAPRFRRFGGAAAGAPSAPA